MEQTPHHLPSLLCPYCSQSAILVASGCPGSQRTALAGASPSGQPQLDRWVWPLCAPHTLPAPRDEAEQWKEPVAGEGGSGSELCPQGQPQRLRKGMVKSP